MSMPLICSNWITPKWFIPKWFMQRIMNLVMQTFNASTRLLYSCRQSSLGQVTYALPSFPSSSHPPPCLPLHLLSEASRIADESRPCACFVARRRPCCCCSWQSSDKLNDDRRRQGLLSKPEMLFSCCMKFVFLRDGTKRVPLNGTQRFSLILFSNQQLTKTTWKTNSGIHTFHISCCLSLHWHSKVAYSILLL